MTKPWKWEPVQDCMTPKGNAWVLKDGRGRNRASVYSSGTWATWDERGTGGENDRCEKVQDAMDQALAAVVRQGWTPFKVIYKK